MTPEQIIEQAFFLFAPDDADWEQYKVRRDNLMASIRAYGDAREKAGHINAAAYLERRAAEIEDGQDVASPAAWMARIFRGEAQAIRELPPV